MSAAALVELYRAKKLRLATAESCTGGLVAGAITAIPGSSAVFTHGFVTYANAAKTQMLGVPETMLAANGAVSAPVARAMAEGARRLAEADYAVSVTGIAGPDGGSIEKPVGTVWFGIAGRNGSMAHHQRFHGERDEIRAQAVTFAISLLAQAGTIQPADAGGDNSAC
ncbi:CinA family protein [Acidocella facilis]|uniref:CinA family protein n=1 Tax=Acidocella facilis TaxID=525 RepID=UPI001F21E148|nr:CinA family protein [Acidocella facilis]